MPGRSTMTLSRAHLQTTVAYTSHQAGFEEASPSTPFGTIAVTAGTRLDDKEDAIDALASLSRTTTTQRFRLRRYNSNLEYQTDKTPGQCDVNQEKGTDTEALIRHTASSHTSRYNTDISIRRLDEFLSDRLARGIGDDARHCLGVQLVEGIAVLHLISLFSSSTSWGTGNLPQTQSSEPGRSSTRR